MDRAEIPGGVDPIPNNTSCMDGKMQRHCPPPPVSKVLDDDDLLIEIIVRLGLPTALVRAILVCKRWFGIVSQKAFLRRFRSLHPPCLLGFYVSTRLSTSLKQICPHFVPMLPQPPEIAAAVRRAESYSLDAYKEDFTCIYECQNDTIFVCSFQGRTCLFQGFQLHWPLCPNRGVLHIPMCQHPHELGEAGITAAHFLLKDEGDGKSLTYIWFSVDYLIEGKGKKYSLKYKAHIYVLQDGLWHWRSSATAMLHSPQSNGVKPLLSGNMIYMENCTSIVALDLTTSSFSTIPLPEGMDQYVSKDMMLSRANGSGFHLIHLEKLQLRIWLYEEDSGGSIRNWLLLDTICLREMLDALGMSYQTSDGEQLTLFDTNQMGDNLQFVFLKMDRCALYLDIKRRELRKVYEVTDDRILEQIHPFMMTWPPTFPVLKDAVNFRVDPIPNNTSCMDGKMQRHCPPPPVSKVLDDDDLLIEIIVRLGLPTALVRAILVCKRWFGIVSQKAFLRRFRSLHPPCLLGFYVSTRLSTSLKQICPHFVLMLPQPPEIAAAVRRAESYSLDAYKEDFTCIYECQNDTIFVCSFQGRTCLFQGFQLHWPLCPNRGVLHIPMCQHPHELGEAGITAAHFLLKDEGDGKSLTYIWFSVDYLIEGKGKKYSLKYKAHIYVLQDGLWHWRSSATAMLHSPQSNGVKPLLSGNMIYMENCTSIVALDLTTSSFSTIPLPEGMDQYVSKDMMLSRANGSGFHLIHLEKLQLRIWLYGEDSGGSIRNWLLLDTICLREMLDALGMSYQTSDGEQLTLFDTNQMGDNLQFVFLKMDRCALYLDIKRRELRKVYEVTDDRILEQIHPFMMTWPPTFPVLKDDPARTVT